MDSEGSQLLPDRTTVYSAERDVSFTYVGCAAILSFVLIFVTVLKWRHREGASPGFDVAPS